MLSLRGESVFKAFGTNIQVVSVTVRNNAWRFKLPYLAKLKTTYLDFPTQSGLLQLGFYKILFNA